MRLCDHNYYCLRLIGREERGKGKVLPLFFYVDDTNFLVQYKVYSNHELSYTCFLVLHYLASSRAYNVLIDVDPVSTMLPVRFPSLLLSLHQPNAHVPFLSKFTFFNTIPICFASSFASSGNKSLGIGLFTLSSCAHCFISLVSWARALSTSVRPHGVAALGYCVASSSLVGASRLSWSMIL
jgi:hypothetical protein